MNVILNAVDGINDAIVMPDDSCYVVVECIA